METAWTGVQGSGRPRTGPGQRQSVPLLHTSHAGRTSTAWENSPSEDPTPTPAPSSGVTVSLPLGPRVGFSWRAPPPLFRGETEAGERQRPLDPAPPIQWLAEGREGARPSSSPPRGRSLQGWGRSSARAACTGRGLRGGVSSAGGGAGPTWTGRRAPGAEPWRAL